MSEDVTFDTNKASLPRLNDPAPDFDGNATPTNWRPGDKVIVSSPVIVKEAKQRTSAGYECTDSYFCEKEIPVTQPTKKLQEV